jgi:hypothetical protein
MSWVITGGNTYIPMDSSAASYITAVEAADGQALEPAVRCAIDQFVLGCKTDGIWTAIKASCILAGARTLTGALVPLVGDAPTNVNFASGDYDRKTGISRSANNKYLNSNRAQNADGQNDHHLSIWKSDTINADDYYMGSGSGGIPGNYTLIGRSLMYSRNISDGIAGTGTSASAPSGLWGISRTGSTSVQYKRGSTAAATVTTAASLANLSINHFVCTFNNNGTADSRVTSRFAFYSIGSSLNLTLLDTRVTTLINAIDAAI